MKNRLNKLATLLFSKKVYDRARSVYRVALAWYDHRLLCDRTGFCCRSAVGNQQLERFRLFHHQGGRPDYCRLGCCPVRYVDSVA